jgi:hypothetical protein
MKRLLLAGMLLIGMTAMGSSLRDPDHSPPSKTELVVKDSALDLQPTVFTYVAPVDMFVTVENGTMVEAGYLATVTVKNCQASNTRLTGDRATRGRVYNDLWRLQLFEQALPKSTSKNAPSDICSGLFSLHYDPGSCANIRASRGCDLS